MAGAAAPSPGSPTIPHLIISSPYEAPASHWSYDRETRLFHEIPARRPAGFIRATPNARGFDDPGVFVPLPLVNQIRARVDEWRTAGYPGATGTTRRLLEHWRNPDARPSNRRLFFCQLEAIETLIWLTEAPPAERTGAKIPGDGGAFRRYCAKMATGTGKTTVMAMLIAWQVLNKVANPRDRRFSKYFLVVAPGLTVKSRLQVLQPSGQGNFYAEFALIPAGPRVRKLGAESDEAFATRVLGPYAAGRNFVVINDEAHHAWRVPPKTRLRGFSKEESEEATLWIGGLDRIHARRGILNCYDFTATPFAPAGRASGEETLYG